MSSSEEEDEFSDDSMSDSTDFDEFNTTTDYDDDDDDEDSSDENLQPIHFRECLRLLDAALTANNPPILPRWCHSEHLGAIEDPVLMINGYRRSLSLPMNKQEARRLIRKAEPLPMKIDLIDGVSFPPSAYQLPAESFRLSNPKWQSDVEPYLKETCVARSLQLRPSDIELRVSQLVLLESCQFPRQFLWSKDKQQPSTIAKLFVTLPSTYKGGKETFSYLKEKHVFDLSDKAAEKCSSSFTIVPLSDECQHEIDFISTGYKLILIYDVISLTPTSCYNVEINEVVMHRISRIFETWSRKLINQFHGYSSKVIVPFSDTFHPGNNPLLHGADRLIGTLLRRTIEDDQPGKFLLYQGFIQPNRSSDGTVHACRSLTDLQLMVTETTGQKLFQKIDSCLGNCNETYSGNIFLRRTISEQGNFVNVEQFHVPIWCLVPVSHQYELFLDHLPLLLTHLEENLIPHSARHPEAFSLLHWFLTTPKKIHFNSKSLLHQLLRLLPSPDASAVIRQLFEHKKFLEQFFPMENKQEYDDIVHLLTHSTDERIQFDVHQLLRNVLKRRSRDPERMKDAIKFIGILATEGVESSFILVLVHELLENTFRVNQPIPSLTDLTNLLALLSLFIDAYQPSCQIIAEQILRQIKIGQTTTTSSTTITNLLRAVLVPTLVQIYRHFLAQHEKSSTNQRKRKRETHVSFPPWFVSLYQTCLSLLNDYCNSSLPIPFYPHLSSPCDCSLCQQLMLFLADSNVFEATFLIASEHIAHFNTLVQKITPLLIITKSISSDQQIHQINLIKMSKDDEELGRESNLLRSLLDDIPLVKNIDDRSVLIPQKRFKSSH